VVTRATAHTATAPLILHTFVFGPGETTRTVQIAVHDDPFDELDETYTVTLSNPVKKKRGA
jgi:hypothetical protein